MTKHCLSHSKLLLGQGRHKMKMINYIELWGMRMRKERYTHIAASRCNKKNEKLKGTELNFQLACQPELRSQEAQ